MGGGGKTSSPCAVEAELKKAGSTEGRRVNRLQEHSELVLSKLVCHSELYYCQAEEETLKVSGEESPSINSGILRAKNNSHPQNDVTANEPVNPTFSRGEKELVPSTCARGKEFQHDKGVLEIQDEGAICLCQRCKQESSILKNSKAGLPRHSVPRNDVQTPAPDGFALLHPTENPPLREGEFKKASLIKGGGPLAVEGLKPCHSELYYCQAEDETIKVTGEESPSINSGILRAKNDCHPQNDVMVHEPIKFIRKRRGKFALSNLVKIILTYLLTNLLTPVKNLVPYYPSALVTSKNFAFTLAEVLITLGIIGVIAAMTLPSIMVKKRNLELESRFKTAYSLISQAVLRMSADNADIAGTYCAYTPNSDGERPSGYSTIDFAVDFSKYFQTTKTYFKRTNNLTDLGYKDDRFKQAFKDEVFNFDAHNNGAFFVKNGMLIASSGCWWFSNGKTPVDFIVDTNGIKGPNRFGYDVFYFQITNDNILMPSTITYSFTNLYTNEETCCNFTKSGTCSITVDNGTSCSYFALRNEYPQDTTKKYWENLH